MILFKKKKNKIEIFFQIFFVARFRKKYGSRNKGD